MPTHILPTSTLGKWSIGLIIAMPILIISGAFLANGLYGDVPAGNSIWEDLSNRPVLALTMLGGMLCALAACVTGYAALLKQKDHSIAVFIVTVLSTLFVLFLVSELIKPH